MVEPSDELVVLCDPSGAAIGTEPKATVHHENTPLHLAFSCYVFDRDGRFLVSRRAASKRTWPSIRTNSCCGHPLPGESMTAAITRRLRDELGLTVTSLDLLLPRFGYRAVMPNGTVENELCPVYRAIADAGPLDPAPDEVAEAWWQPWADFVAIDQPGIPAHRGVISRWPRWSGSARTRCGGRSPIRRCCRPLRWPEPGPDCYPADTSLCIAGPGSRPGSGGPMNLPQVVSREEWLAARKELLTREKELTRARDTLNADRRRLPMVLVDKQYGSTGPDGAVGLLDLFDGSRQLIVQHAMWLVEEDRICPGCTAGVDELSDGIIDAPARPGHQLRAGRPRPAGRSAGATRPNAAGPSRCTHH